MLRSLDCPSSSQQHSKAKARVHSIQSSALWMLGSSISGRGPTPPLYRTCARWRSQSRSMAPYLHRDWIVALALPRWPLTSVSFPARSSAIFATQTGLAPKRYTAVRRFSGALRQVALGRGSLAHIASEAGYSDQAHLTTDLRRQ